jgi:hypothetical protein
MDWHDWHSGYDRPGSALDQRLACVQERIREALDVSPPGPLQAISVCAGQGRDLLGVLADHPRGRDVTARLVELDERNVAQARRTATDSGLDQVDIVTGDAASTACYDGMVPADLVLICGLFGNISRADIDRTLDHCPALCATGATLIWTRHRKPPDLFPHISARLESLSFETTYLSAPDLPFGVGSHRFTGRPMPLPPDTHLFTFAGYDTLAPRTPPR